MSAIKRLNIKDVDSGAVCSDAQKQTGDCFGFKWSKRDTYESQPVKDANRNWLMERYCNNDPKLLDDWLAGERKIILDAGCGAGYSAMLLFGDHLKKHDYLGIDISDAVTVAAQRFRESGYAGEFLKRDLFDLEDIPEKSVHIIFSEGVLHHTDNTERAFRYLAEKLKPGGLFMFYVYAKKAVIREFTDDYIRNQIKNMSDSEAWESLKPLTNLGIALGELNVEVNVPEDIPFLGIKKGKMDLQRFFYWNICKMYYRPEFSIEEMNHFNFDWFRPLNCHRHTPEEIRGWCKAMNLEIIKMNVQESGSTVVACKQ